MFGRATITLGIGPHSSNGCFPGEPGSARTSLFSSSSCRFPKKVEEENEDRIPTNLEILEYGGISLNMENSQNSQGFLCNLAAKNYNK